MSIYADTISFSNEILSLLTPQANPQKVVIDVPTPGIAIGLGSSSLATDWFPIRTDDTPFYLTLLPGEWLWMTSFNTTGEVSIISSYVDPLGD